VGEEDSSPIAVGILEQLFYTPTISIAQIAERFNVSYQAVSTLVVQLEKVQILRETTGRKRDKRYVYRRLTSSGPFNLENFF
jgi:DNA-binding MarR family transcriptional regulator